MEVELENAEKWWKGLLLVESSRNARIPVFHAAKNLIFMPIKVTGERERGREIEREKGEGAMTVSGE